MVYKYCYTLPYTFFQYALLCVLWLFSATTFAADINGVRVWRAPDHTRVVFDLSASVAHTVMTLNNPDRIVIDVPVSAFKASLNDLDLSKTPIQRIRTGVRNGKDLRFVLDLQANVQPRSFVLKASDKASDRLVLDLYDVGSKPRASVAKAEVPHGKRDIIIAIDAGHGGEDPGALGAHKLQEKDVVLAIARELKRQLDRIPGYKPVMIRDGDYYVGLGKRRSLAREKHADMFVSIHADAFHSPKASGSSVYALSQSGATSASAKFLAQSENSSDVIGGVSLSDKDDVLAGVLFDLSMTATLDSSLNVGKRILGNMGGVNKLHKKQVEQAGFAVLKSPDVPSILIETGFISNPAEAKRLANKRHQRKMASAIADGIGQFFYDTAPEGTLVAANKQRRKQKQTHVIARGDTLSEIAQRYQVSVAHIRDSNNLRSSSIKIGQKLTIPAI